MLQSRIYSTALAVLCGLLFAFVIIQIQYNPSFLLGDVLRLTIPENFVGVYYLVKEDSLEVSYAGLSRGDTVSVAVSYNPDRVLIDLDGIQSDYTIGSVESNVGEILVVLVVDADAGTLFHLPFVSDAEYHIVVSAASLTGLSSESLAIQRL